MTSEPFTSCPQEPVAWTSLGLHFCIVNGLLQSLHVIILVYRVIVRIPWEKIHAEYFALCRAHSQGSRLATVIVTIVRVCIVTITLKLRHLGVPSWTGSSCRAGSCLVHSCIPRAEFNARHKEGTHYRCHALNYLFIQLINVYRALSLCRAQPRLDSVGTMTKKQ